MAVSTTPDSYKPTASASTYSDFLAALRDHIANYSTKWSVKHDGVDGSGDEGLTLSPDDQNETFDFNARYDSTDDQPYIAVDPKGDISDPNNPTGTGSAEVSNEPNPVGNSGPTWHTNFLVAEWKDAIAILFKDSSNDHIPVFWAGGKFYEPAFANDPARKLDGLTVLGGRLDNGSRKYGFTRHSSSNTSEIRTPDGFQGAGSVRGGDEEPDGWANSDSPYPIPIELSEYIDDISPVGMARYIYKYHTSGGGRGLRILDSGDGDGFLFLSSDGSARPWLIGWDPSVSPT